MVGGIDLNKPRLRHVAQAVIALSASPDGFTASALADQVRAFGNQSPSAYGPRQAAYDLKKLRGKQIVQRIGSTRRYEPHSVRSAGDHCPARAPRQSHQTDARRRSGHQPQPAEHKTREPSIATTMDLRLAMKGVFHELGIAA